MSYILIVNNILIFGKTINYFMMCHQLIFFIFPGLTIRFSAYEFGIITGLKFGEKPNTNSIATTSMSLREKYFIGENIKIPRLDKIIEEMDFCSIPDEDALRLTLIYFIERFLLCKARKRTISLFLLKLVEHLELFNNYPWGSEAFELTFASLSSALKGRREKYLERLKAKQGAHDIEHYDLYGCPFVFQVLLTFST
jgi:hypothetical protein